MHAHTHAHPHSEWVETLEDDDANVSKRENKSYFATKYMAADELIILQVYCFHFL